MARSARWLLALLVLPPVPLARAQLSVQVAPDNGNHPDPKIRLANSTGNTVVFTVINNGTIDAQFTRTCVGLGNVGTVTCGPVGIIAAGDSKTVTATFDVGAAGTGSVQLTVTSVVPTGVSNVGKWDETIVNPGANVTPDGAAITKAPNLTGTTQVFTATNTSRAAGTYGMAVSCTGAGISGCSVSPATLALDSAGVAGASGTATVTYNTLAAGGAGTVTVTASFAGTSLDQGSALISIPNAEVTPEAGTQTVGPSLTGQVATFSVKNTGAAQVAFDVSVGCTGAITGCNVAPVTVNPLPGLSQNATVTFTSGASGSGVITLTAKYAGVTLDIGTITVTIQVIAPVVAVTPKGGAPLQVPPNSARSASFTVTHSGLVPSTYTLAAVCTAPGATACPTLSPLSFPVAGNSAVPVSFTSGAAGSSGRVKLTATHSVQTTVKDTGYVDVHVVSALVTPKAVPVTVAANTTGLTYSFDVKNQGLSPTTFALAAACSGAGGVNGCSSSASVTLAAGQTLPVVVTYNTGAAGLTGTVSLTATFSGVTIDQGSINVTAQTQAAPTVDVATVNPESVVDRGQCVALALGSAAASECGDLRLVHSLPAVRTLNQWRSPMLTYTSAHATGWVSVGANVGLPANSAVPTTVSASLTVGGSIRASGTWTGGQWTAGSVRRIALGFDAATAGLGTGAYAYSLSVTNTFGASSPAPTVATGTLVIVNRSTSPMGSGWWLSGLEEWNPATAFWVGGDGSARQYTLRPGSVAPNRVWGAASVTYPDSVREVGTEFVRQLPDSVWVYFNAQGRHVRTRNRLGHVTQFGYDGCNRLQTITLPTWTAGAPSYTLTYGSGCGGKLATVVAPGAAGTRTTTISIIAAGRVARIQDPDLRVVRFDSTSTRITSRADRRGTITNFQYDVGNRVSQSTIVMVTVPNIVRIVTQALSAGFNGSAVDTTAVFTRLNGPRTNVNLTTFYLNRFGAPTRIVDGANQTTTLARTKPGFSGLVTQVTTVTGQSITATHDARGRVLTTSQALPAGQATTTYVWDTKWDMVTKITNPQGDFTDFGVDAATGNRLWQQDGRGITSRTSFTYHTTKQLETFTLPGTTAQTYGYDGLGNLNTFDSALDYFWTWTNDPIGRTTGISSPTGIHVGGSPYQTETVTYSLRNEETQRVTTAGGQTITVTRGLDEEGNLLTVGRTFSPNPQGIAALTTSSAYDRANRVTSQTEPDGQSETRGLDEAGNVTTLVPRLGGTISMSYDALNRMLTRSVPGGYPNTHPTSQILPATAVNVLPYSFTVPADNQSFTYYADGQVATATNIDATVGRAYHPSGLQTSETLQIRTADRSGFGTHSYTTSYQYNVNGRRTGLTAPTLLPGSTMTFGYDPQWGALTSATDIQGNAFGFSYNARGDLTGRTYPGSVSQTLGYDADGRLSSDNLTGATQGWPYPPSTVLRSFGVGSRDAATKIRASTDGALFFDRATAGYSGLGYLQTPYLKQQGQNAVTGGTATYASADTLSYDGLGNLTAKVQRDTIDVGAGVQITRVASTQTYNTQARLTSRLTGGATTAYTYDTQGNTYFEAETGLPTGGNGRERAAWFGRDGRLRATDSRTSGRRTFEEYRYDALGRRVWVRQRTQCEPINAVTCASPFARRTIWDGAQELAEIQAPYDSAVATLEELDSGWPLQPYNLLAGTDPNPFYGRVVYSPGLVVDQPLSVTRYDYRDNPNGASTLTWPTFTLVPYWNYQGLAAFGTFSEGTSFRPYAAGLPSCPALGNTTPQRCVILQWQFAHSAYDQNRGKITWRSWHGSLLEGKRDRSGLDYRRARVYDPETGRFTQEDPIGLAGGLNLYGFANGDPVNFSDPFGLCPMCIVWAIRAAPYVASAATFIAQAIDPTPGDPGTAIVQSVGRLGSAAAHAAQEGKAALGRVWTTQRRAFWKAEAAAEGAVGDWGASNVELMKRGRAAQYTDDAGNLVPYELHHTPTGQAAGGTKVRIVTSEEHALVDPNRRLKQNP